MSASDEKTPSSSDVSIDIPPYGFFPWETEHLGRLSCSTDSGSSSELPSSVVPRLSTNAGTDGYGAENASTPDSGKNRFSSSKKRSVKMSTLIDNPFVLEYLTELEWVTRCAKKGTTQVHSDSNGITEPCSVSPSLASDNSKPFYEKPISQNTSHFHRRFRVRSHLKSKLPSALPLFLTEEEERSSHATEPTCLEAPSAMIVVPSMSCYQREPGSRSMSSAFDVFSPLSLHRAISNGRIPRSCHASLAACHPLRSRYGETHTSYYNKNLLLDSADYNNVHSSDTENPESSDLSRIATGTFQTSSSHPQHYAALLVNPLEPLGITSFMTQLNPNTTHCGVPSPISPIAPEAQNQQSSSHTTGSAFTGLQPQHMRRNLSRFCIAHQPLSANGSVLTAKFSATTSGWSWDKSEPLGLPGLCSCHNEELYRIWDTELKLHKTYCLELNERQCVTEDCNGKRSRSNATSSPRFRYFSGLDVVDWDAVLKRLDFSSFLYDIGSQAVASSLNSLTSVSSHSSNAYRQLHYCFTCGGLPYVPFSFIELPLNREIPTLYDLARQLPLPVPTELFCDGGLRITACLVTRSPLHEWLALKALSFIDMISAAKVFQVCSQFIYPFHRLPEVLTHSAQVGSRKDQSVDQGAGLFQRPLFCPRHNLMHYFAPHQSSVTDPPRFTLLQSRRPYCLRPRLGLQDADVMSQSKQDTLPLFFQEALKEACFAWLKKQHIFVSPSRRQTSEVMASGKPYGVATNKPSLPPRSASALPAHQASTAKTERR